MGRSDAITLLATEAGRQLVPASSQALLEAILTCDDLSLSLSCGLPSVAEPQVARSQRLFPDEADYFADVRQQAHSDNAVPPSLPYPLPADAEDPEAVPKAGLHVHVGRRASNGAWWCSESCRMRF